MVKEAMEHAKDKAKEFDTHLCTECSKLFKTSRGLQCHFFFSTSKHSKKDLHAFDYEVLLPKSKLKDFIQLSKEKNKKTEVSRDSLFYTTHNSRTTTRTRESYLQ